MAGGARRGAGVASEGRAEGVHAGRARALVDDEPNARGALASPRAGAAPFRDSAALGPAIGAARLQRAGLAGAHRVATRFVDRRAFVGAISAALLALARAGHARSSESAPSMSDPISAWNERGARDGGCGGHQYARSDLLWAVTAGDPGFVAVGNRGAVTTSRDGISWQQRQASTRAVLRAVTYALGRYVAVGAGQIIFESTDGVEWHRRGVAGPAMLGGVTYGEAGFVAVGTAGFITRSSDAQSWEQVESGTLEDFFGVAFGNGVYVGVTASGGVFASEEGRTWDHVFTGAAWLWDVVYGHGRFVAVGAGVALSSKDGRHWLEASRGSIGAMRGVTFGKSRFLATGGPGEVFVSKDGVAWSRAPYPSVEQLWRPTYGQGMYVVVGPAGLINATRNRKRWAARSCIVDALYGVAASPERYVAVGTNGVMATSEDAHAWSRLPLVTEHEMRGTAGAKGVSVD